MPSLFESDTIMPTRLDARRNCWKNRSSLEKILILAIVLAIIVVIILGVLLSNKSDLRRTESSCNTTACLIEAGNIMQYVDSETDPCDDFYQFACGNFMKRAHGDDSFRFMDRMASKHKRQVLEVYSEPIVANEPAMVKTAKKLFQSCMDENNLESENLKSIKRAIASVGGWPVLDGDRWNETKFDWLQATYRLRKLGYHHSAFLDLTVEPNRDTHVLKVELPDVFDYSSHNFDKLDFMVETALAFGATNRDKITAEMQLVHNFLIDLQLQTHNNYGSGNSTQYTVAKYQQKYGVVDWLQFLNNLTNPVLTVRKNDTVIFPPAPTMKNWIGLITNTPKRTQANFLIWTVIEKILPYLPDKYQNYNVIWKKPQTLQETCLERIHDKFLPNPIDIMCDRRYLPLQKKRKVEELVSNIQAEFLSSLAGKPEKLQNMVKTMRLAIGQPDDYFSDEIFKKVAVDMIGSGDNSFISLMAQAIRNQRSMLYAKVGQKGGLYDEWYQKALISFIAYNREKNVLYLSSVFTQDEVFSTMRPEYMNYGSLGTTVGHQLSLITQEFGQSENMKCVIRAMRDYRVNLDMPEVNNIVQFSVGSTLAYSAYEKHFKEDQNMLIGLNFTPKQLFWLATTSILCEPVNPYHKFGVNGTLISAKISGFVRHHPNFANDFMCKPGSKMSAAVKCDLV
ncbi:hypothetical protein PPYR_00923 [Photinus pyralis]|uniref:Peptidase M13 N-terminal domain-containing protein n=1 Tax=Photinus pyralis TaxID=7054 RepID=A0A1Y1M541_PHOPY|nr:neprilysin-2-like [Photinus pyralis]KAB0803953.1 hypothetical protein PPYR_00923 [Photinus pyralis]